MRKQKAEVGKMLGSVVYRDIRESTIKWPGRKSLVSVSEGS